MAGGSAGWWVSGEFGVGGWGVELEATVGISRLSSVGTNRGVAVISGYR